MIIIYYRIIYTRKARYILSISIPECLVFTVSSHLSRTHKSSWTKLQSAILSDMLQSNMSQPTLEFVCRWYSSCIPFWIMVQMYGKIYVCQFCILDFWKVCFKFNWFEFLKGFLLGGRAINGWSVFFEGERSSVGVRSRCLKPHVTREQTMGTVYR